jgi:hypothetical protein
VNDVAQSNVAAQCSGISAIWMLTILFIGLKLAGHIDWSWWWVFSPLWIAALFIVGLLFLAWVFFFIAALLDR